MKFEMRPLRPEWDAAGAERGDPENGTKNACAKERFPIE